MSRRDPAALIDNLALDEESVEPLIRQLYRSLRDLILSGGLKSGAKLPSTRTLARHFRVARTTIVSAFEPLAAEGFI
ncbi:MAG TPA: winged helix-turn-helix domain-containing protein [Alphaproteobacteria bacterium]